MKFQTTLDKILALEDKQLKILKLQNFAFKLFPQSPQQLKVRAILQELKSA